MVDESLSIALVLTALVLVAFAWMVTSSRRLTKGGDHKVKDLKERVAGLEHRTSALQRDVQELTAQAEKKAEQAYVEKRINGLIGLVKGKSD